MTAHVSPAVVLIVAGDPCVQGALRAVVEPLDVRVTHAATGHAALGDVAAQCPALVILDADLPDATGEQLCTAIRAVSAAPMIVVSAHVRAEQEVRVLDAGADDYVAMPFSPAELAARVRAHLRRATQHDPHARSALRLGALELDLDRRAARDVRGGGRAVHLTPIEWSILRALAGAAGRTLTHQQLFDAVWGRQFGDASQYLRVHVTNLRRKIEPDPARPTFVVTEPGSGYRLVIDES